MKRYIILAACFAAVSLGACAGESKFPVATGEGNIRAINTIPTAPAFSFLIEERPIGSVEYKTASTTAQYDDLAYTFNFEVALAGDISRTRVASQFLDVVADKDYTFVISGSIAAPTITLWESDVREWSDNETTFEARFAHTAASRDPIDIYFAPAMDPPTPPVAGSALDTVAFGEITPTAEFEEGEYILTVTEAGDETMILFQSDPFIPIAQTSVIISVFDSDANDLAPVFVSVLSASGSGTAQLVDSNFLPTLRFYHASIDAGAVDIYVEDPVATPKVANHMFMDVTGDIEVPAGDLPLTYTTAAPMGMVLIDEDRTVAAASRTNYYFIRSAADEDALVTARLDRRSIETFAQFSVINTSNNHDIVDVYIVEADELIDEVGPILPIQLLGAPPVSLPLLENSYDVYVTDFGEKDVLAGPLRLDAARGDVLEAIIYDNVDPAIVDLVFVPQP